MYEEHFGLSRRPFGETVDPASLVALPSREATARRLRYGLEQGHGPALLFGPPGSGKTLLARWLARTIASETGGAVVHLTFPALPVADLLAFLSEELGVSSPDRSMAGWLRGLRQTLSTVAGQGARPLLVVDEAHLIDDTSTFEALRALQNFATLGPPDLLLLFVGGPEILLKLPGGLADRLTSRCLLGPLSEAESRAYLLGRLHDAGAREPMFSPEALALLHRAADGLPRRLNRLADLALLIAYAEGLPRPDPHAVAAAAREADPDALAA